MSDDQALSDSTLHDRPADEVSSALRELAAEHGVATDFWDWQGRHRPVARASVEAVLAALGVAAHTDESVLASLADVREQPWRRTLPPCVVTRSGREQELRVHVPHGEPVTAWVELEDGGRVDLAQTDRWVDPREVAGRLVGEATFSVPGDLPLGWHTVLRGRRPRRHGGPLAARRHPGPPAGASTR